MYDDDDDDDEEKKGRSNNKYIDTNEISDRGEDPLTNHYTGKREESCVYRPRSSLNRPVELRYT